MNYQQRIEQLTQVGAFFGAFLKPETRQDFTLLKDDMYQFFEKEVDEASYKNPWFIRENIDHALQAWANALTRSNIEDWLNSYPDLKNHFEKDTKRVGIVMAGNIPLVGFHDFICCFLSGHHAVIKLSKDDHILFRAIAKIMEHINPSYTELFSIVDKLENFDAVIATGSNNTARYFDYYFGKYPHIIRKNRNSIAVLSGNESENELSKLGEDIFRYFGLGCRNVSKLYVPVGYDFKHFFEAIQKYEKVQFQSKYVNNYDFNKSIYLVNKEDHFDNGFLLLKEDLAIGSPISVVYFEYYNDIESVRANLSNRYEEIQCIVGGKSLGVDFVHFGEAQNPILWDYADGIDTLKFLMNLK